jgi:hypothetical protein
MNAELHVDRYLTTLRANLPSLTITEREEIVREITAHVRDSAEQSGASVETILAGLGSAENLAAQYRDGLLIRRASRSFSPLVLLRATLRLATKGIAGIVVFMLGLFGYALGGGLVVTALVKPIFPANSGIWVDGSGHFMSLGVMYPPSNANAHVVPGLWYIPAMLTAGSLTLLFTTWAIKTFLRFSQRWQSRL